MLAQRLVLCVSRSSKTREYNLGSLETLNFMQKRGVQLTGMPPRTGFDPSRAALEETKRRSRLCESVAALEGDFQDITVAPYNKISALAPYKF